MTLFDLYKQINNLKSEIEGIELFLYPCKEKSINDVINIYYKLLNKYYSFKTVFIKEMCGTLVVYNDDELTLYDLYVTKKLIHNKLIAINKVIESMDNYNDNVLILFENKNKLLDEYNNIKYFILNKLINTTI